MKNIVYVIIFLLAYGSILSANNSTDHINSNFNTRTPHILDNTAILDTIPASKDENDSRMMLPPSGIVEIDGKLKINLLPTGDGTEILADENGNLFRKNMTSTTPPFGSTDSLTYIVTTGPGIPLTGGTFNLTSFTESYVSNSGSELYYCNLIKYKDVNSIGFIELLLEDPSQATNLVIEIKYFKQGESNPYWGNKMTNIKVTSHQRVFERGTDRGQENISLSSVIYGIKDYSPGGSSFAYNTSTQSFVTY